VDIGAYNSRGQLRTREGSLFGTSSIIYGTIIWLIKVGPKDLVQGDLSLD